MAKRQTSTASRALWASLIATVHSLLLLVLLGSSNIIRRRPAEVGTSFIMLANVTDKTLDGRLDVKPVLAASGESASAESPEKKTPTATPAATSTAAIEPVAFSQAEPGEQAHSPSLAPLVIPCACPPADGYVAGGSCAPPHVGSECPPPPGS